MKEYMEYAFSYHTQMSILDIYNTDEYITQIKFVKQTSLKENPKQNILGQELITQIREYLAGRLVCFDLPLKLSGTIFQNKVWEALRRIPYGETVSYRDIAQEIGRPKGARAVGGANNKNSIAIVVPCHRVIGNNGRIVGYAGGVDIQRYLLELEQKSAGNVMQ